MAIRHLILCAAAATPVNSMSDDGFTLHLFDPKSGALCLDGSPGGYYSRPGDPKRWMIELEGGGWCVNEQDCLSRSKTDIGSSVSWPATGCPGMDGGSNGMFSDDCSESAFCNFTAIHLNYCDGASFAGFVAAPVAVQGTDIFFRGITILNTMIDTMLANGLATASELIVKGCSAGGLATYLHLDYFASRVRSVNPTIRIVGMPDAGFFLDHASVTGAQVYTPIYQYVAQMQNVTQIGAVNDDCLANYAPAGEAWKCFMAQYTLPFIKTAYFATQDLDDSWQMQNIFLLPCQPWVSGSCNATYVAALAQYRTDMLAALAPLLASPVNGGFLTSCVQHCHQNIASCWSGSQVQGQGEQASFLSWYNGGPLQRIVVDGDFGSDTHCDCSPYSAALGRATCAAEVAAVAPLFGA